MLVTLFRLLSTLPLSVLHALGAALGWFVYAMSPSYRRRLKGNIGAAGFGSELGAAIRESGKNIAELPFIWCADPKRVLNTVTIENWEIVQTALEAKQGAIFLTPHLGCFEITAQAIATQTPMPRPMASALT